MTQSGSYKRPTTRSRSTSSAGAGARDGSRGNGGPTRRRARVDSAYERTRRDLEARRDLETRRSATRQRTRSEGARDAEAGGQARKQAHARYDTSRYAARTTPAQRFARRMPRGSRRTRVLAVAGVIVALAVAVGLVGSHVSGSSSIAGSGSSFASIQTDDVQEVALPTPIMAECDGVELHSAVAMQDLTEILIHNASYSYACELTTQLVEATNSEVKANHGTGRVASEQPTGDEWMTGEFIRCYRSGNGGPTLSAIDCGGAAGTTVYAPVSGTVVLVKEYLLYDAYDDYQIHIQPEGRDDLDVVLIHVQNVCVEAGDTVEAGVTELAEIRDVYAYIGESMQLKDYTAQDDNGNHTHIQVNDVTDETYTGLDDLEADGGAAAGE